MSRIQAHLMFSELALPFANARANFKRWMKLFYCVVIRDVSAKTGTEDGPNGLAIRHNLGSLSVPWLRTLQCPLPVRVSPVFVQVVSPPLGWSPSGDTLGPSVVFAAVDVLCPGPLSVDCVYERYLLPDPDVGPSVHVENMYFHFGMCGRNFVLCLFGQCPGLCTIFHSCQHTEVVHLSLQADDKGAFEDIPSSWRIPPSLP